MTVDVDQDLLETHLLNVPSKTMARLMIYVSTRNVVRMQFVILGNVSVLLALKEMTHTMLQLAAQPSPNVLTTPTVDIMRSVQRFKTVTLANVLMHVAELLVDPTHVVSLITIIEHAFATKDFLEIQMMSK